ncbi:MAG: hypothetical protein IJS07_01865, partial [Bacteroidales bacterium]|nr:hypothetical protein [Bacteroidales bacterium]
MIPNRFFTILFMAILLSCSGSEPANGTGTGIGSIDSSQGGQTEEGGDTGEGGDGPLVEKREGAVTLDGAATIRTFEGLGALASYGKLLYDYPEPQRSQILDYLFLPNFGANLQILKVEMGSDGNNTAMAWPSHRRSLQEENDFTRGWSWWYMKEAVKRNPDIILSALNWGWPAWATTDDLKSDFIADYVEGAWNVHGLRIRYIGGNQNESDITPAMTKLLRRKLNERGFGDVKIICADEGAKKARYQVLDYLSTDEEYCNVVDVIGVHYKSREADFMPEVTYSFGKPLWSTEDGGGGYGNAGQGNAWTSQLMKLFIDVKMSAAIRWLVTSSIYDNMPWPGNGIMKTKEPWSGHYIVGANLWSFAHFTQFIKPGWKQLKQDETYLIPETKKGRFIAYRAPVSGGYAIVVDAHDNTLPAEGTVFTWRLTGGLSTGTVYVWKSNFVAGGDWFVKEGTLLPDKDGYVTMKVMPGTVYTLSTVSTARKGSYESPAATPFPFPYTEDFEGYENASTVRYFVDA